VGRAVFELFGSNGGARGASTSQPGDSGEGIGGIVGGDGSKRHGDGGDCHDTTAAQERLLEGEAGNRDTGIPAAGGPVRPGVREAGQADQDWRRRWKQQVGEVFAEHDR